ncbi:MAG: hypothetical protein IPN71_17295 [Fibrobacteres bacterium]|nr:hypothetical protein [Fibrobacterota bacterium]
MIASKFPIAASAVLAVAFAGCSLTGESASTGTTAPSDKSETTDPKATDPKTTDPTTVGTTFVKTMSPMDQSSMRLTTETLQNLSLTSSGSLGEEGRQDLLSANSTFRAKIKSDSGNSAAHFGLAITSLALKADDMAATFRNMNKNGLSMGGVDGQDLFRASPLELAESPALSARALAAPEKSATLRQLQDTLELKFLPTVDSLVDALQMCWNDTGFAYRFKIEAFKDSMAIGRADVGTALVAAQSVQNYLVWLISQDLEAGFSGQGFESHYSWLDTLAHIEIDAGPATAMQKQAFENLKVLFPATGTTSSRNFMGVRAGYQAKVDAIPGKIIQMAKTMKQVADYAHTYQTSLSKGLLRLDASRKEEAYTAADSLIRLLSSPTTLTKEAEYKQENAGYEMIQTATGYTYQSKYETVYYPAVSVKVDLAKIITLGGRQVFFPRFAWNAESQWAAKGPFSLLKGSTSTSMIELSKLKLDSQLDMEPYMEWVDPTFGGIFPEFKSTHDVLAKMEETNPQGTVVAPSARLLPVQAGF